MQPRDDDALLTPSEVAAMFRVNPKTVTRWARAGKISAIRTLGGHRRFRESEIRQFLEQVEQTDQTLSNATVSSANERAARSCRARCSSNGAVSVRRTTGPNTCNVEWPGPASIR